MNRSKMRSPEFMVSALDFLMSLDPAYLSYEEESKLQKAALILIYNLEQMGVDPYA